MAGFFMRGRMAVMRFRKLRIAWSVVWGLVCVLLIAWWISSYYRTNNQYPAEQHCWGHFPCGPNFDIFSFRGRVSMFIGDYPGESQPFGFFSSPLTEVLL